MDWAHSFEDVLLLNPRGMPMTGGPEVNPVTWISKYGSITASVVGYFEQIPECDPTFNFYFDGSTDGVNEMGLAAHALYLGIETGTVYGNLTTSPEDPKNLHYLRWVRYILDNFATVVEAVEGMKAIVTVKNNLCPGFVEMDDQGYELGLHFAIEDKTGDSAIFEFIGGTMQTYHNTSSNNDTLVMTNDPPYDQQLQLLAAYAPWGGEISLPEDLPGSVSSADRFVRLQYYLRYTPKPKTEAEAIANILALNSATNVPFGAPYGGGVYPTWWVSVADVTTSIYYFNWLLTPNLIWVDLSHVDFETIDTYYSVRPQNPDLVGDVTCEMTDKDKEGKTMPECGNSAAATCSH